MEQFFEAFGLNWRLLIIQGVNFGVLLALLTYFLYKPILRIIDERREAIAESVRKAHAADAQLAQATQEKESIIASAARDAEALAAAARVRADEKAGEIVKGAESRAGGILKDAEARAQEAKRQALKESEREIARAAVLAAEKILREKA